ncbi:Hpt domain-containing protein [Desulfovibrio gilichinskyi]|uniref:Hpt domain-containing protein n=1 Tax=Desulfovibrio gilichinskyi TaxID=1519643 RepID=A0A1X7C9T8_9BACT|nr:Hpt domain-containing protein [Desulfovibrio gilichinskyi]SME92231.1 Hpt domain-containing protein [Desulfovibrio gilichinskyi]
MANKIKETINSELERLVGRFMRNTDLEIATLVAAFKKSDFLAINRIGHNIKGTALNYGFKHLAEIGRSIEKAGADEDVENIERLLLCLKDYVVCVEIEFEED